MTRQSALAYLLEDIVSVQSPGSVLVLGRRGTPVYVVLAGESECIVKNNFAQFRVAVDQLSKQPVDSRPTSESTRWAELCADLLTEQASVSIAEGCSRPSVGITIRGLSIRAVNKDALRWQLSKVIRKLFAQQNENCPVPGSGDPEDDDK